MAVDYLTASLPPLAFDGPAPLGADAFVAACRAQLSAAEADAVAAAMALDAPSASAAAPACAHPLFARWRDLDAEMRNTALEARVHAHAGDAAQWRRPAAGCSLFLRARVIGAFAEKDPGRRQTLLDRVRWDAAAELTPVASPLSLGAVFTYAIRLAIVRRRAAALPAAGNAVFDRITTP